jgi:hypothetical protein
MATHTAPDAPTVPNPRHRDVALASAVLIFVLPSSSWLDGVLGLSAGKWPAL